MMMKTVWSILLVIGTIASSSARADDGLAVYRDDLFSNARRGILESRDKGAWLRYDWSYQETVLNRDIDVGLVAKPERVDPLPATLRHDVTYGEGANAVTVSQTGELENARFAIFFIHGAGGTKAIGSSDVNFGANFNHAQSLAVRNNSVYLSPTVTFSPDGTNALVSLISTIWSKSKNAKVIIACGSAGAYTCWNLARSPIGSHLAGLILMSGSSLDESFANTPAGLAHVPVFFSHGTKDPLVPITYAMHSYDVIHAISKDYPVRFESYEGGKHGTTMRLMDWKRVVEWMLTTPVRAERN